ncbi:MAG: helix-turn-helix domain-containing protein [Chthoniobacterales bacterium]
MTDLRVEMLQRGLRLRDVSIASGVPYSTVSGILAGRIIQPENFQKIVRAIESAPEPVSLPAA